MQRNTISFANVSDFTVTLAFMQPLWRKLSSAVKKSSAFFEIGIFCRSHFNRFGFSFTVLFAD